MCDFRKGKGIDLKALCLISLLDLLIDLIFSLAQNTADNVAVLELGYLEKKIR